MAMGHGDGGPAFSLEIDGIEAAVTRIRAEMARTVPRALRRSGDLVAESARAQHGYQDRTGNLTRSIYADPVESGAAGSMHVDVAANANYAAAVEFGTKPHKIRPRKAKVLVFGTVSGKVFAREVNHPGTKPTNFMAEALERETDDVEAELDDALQSAFEAAGFEVFG